MSAGVHDQQYNGRVASRNRARARIGESGYAHHS
jgi:hypothetical protein